MNKLAWLLTVTALSLLLSLLWFEPKTCQSDPLLSCFNHRAIDPNQDWSHYSFVALGHIRTGPKQQGPNRNLKRNLERIFADDPAFVIALGDLYYSISENSIAIGMLRDFRKTSNIFRSDTYTTYFRTIKQN